MAERDVIFKIGNGVYGFNVQIVTAIEQMTEIVSVPNAPDCILGLMNLRGDVIPVYSLRKRFGLEEEAVNPQQNRLIVVSYDHKPLAFKVDEVLEMNDFDDSKLSPQPVIAKNERTAYVRSIANKDGKLVLLLDPASMYEGDEEAQMDRVLEGMNA